MNAILYKNTTRPTQTFLRWLVFCVLLGNILLFAWEATILSGEVDLETLLSLSKKDEPVRCFKPYDEKTPPENEDTESKKDEPVHHFESDDEKTPSKNEDMTSKKDEPAHHFESDDEKTPPKNEDMESKKDEPVHHLGTRVQTQPSTSNSKKQQECSVLIFKDGMFIPNKIQVIEEHENYTVFKVFAVRQ